MKTDMIQVLETNEYCFQKTAPLFPVLQKLKAVPQDPSYHGEGNVWIHTECVCNALLKMTEWKELKKEEKAIVYLAALFHDIGKICCTKEENRKIVSPYHGKKGEKLFRSLWYMEYAETFSLSFEQREEIALLIRYHGLPPLFLEKDPIEYYLQKASMCVSIKLLYLLAKADVEGRICEDKEKLLSMVEYFKEYTKELHCYESCAEFANAYTQFRYFQQGSLWHNTVLFDTTQFDVFLLSGLPLAGKDTYIEKFFKEYPVISLDEIRKEMRLLPTKGSGQAVAAAKERARQYLRQKQPFVWNATNIIEDTRNKLCGLFAEYGARVHFIYIEAPYQELLYRNTIRTRTIPEGVLYNMIFKLEIPSPFEGYSTSYFESGKALSFLPFQRGKDCDKKPFFLS